MKTVVIDPVTRIEGHAKISIFVDDAGEVSNAQFHVVEFRGFEKFCEGRPMWEMAGITARICGICPVSHLLASAKTGDKLLAVQIPIAAEKLRRLMNLGQLLQSHTLSFFHLSSPDFLLGWDSDPGQRNVFGLMAADPDLARAGIRLRQFGQTIIELLGARKIHAAWTVPGGVRSPLSEEARAWIRDRLPESRQTIDAAIGLFKGILDRSGEEVANFGDFPSLFMSLVGDDGRWEHYGGKLRLIDANGTIVADHLSEDDYAEFIGEAVEPWSYLKFPYYKPLGYPGGIYRVGPLARLNTCDFIGSPAADRELLEFRDRAGGRVATSSFFYHYARLIEVLACVEAIDQLIDDPDVVSDKVRAQAGINQLRAVGVSEAPRGTLFHDYQVDSDGLIQKVNLIIATGQNNLAMNQTVTQIAQHYIHGVGQGSLLAGSPTSDAANETVTIPEAMLNRVEAGIRAYDPCLSCSTHALGQMPLHVQVVRGGDRQVLAEVYR